jgi:5'-methylthioadenosine phosphorylase
MSSSIRVGIIGGSGFDRSDILSNRVEHEDVDTPYGSPSDNLVSGTINGIQCILCFRHGRKHSFNPSQLNYRANIWALKQLGANVILATTAVGSLSADFTRGTLVVFDNYIDTTKYRPNSFYDHGPGHLQGVMHMSMHPPYDRELRQLLIQSCAETPDVNYKDKSTVVVIEGPNFSTFAENKVFISWGCTTIGMTQTPETILAKELGLPYAALGIVTDDICWKEDGVVDPNEVIQVLKQHSQKQWKY